MPESTQFEVWERLPGESNAAWRAFKPYRDYGPKRTVSDVYRLVKGKPTAKMASGIWYAWREQYQWEERCRAYDAHMERVAQRAKEDAIRQQVQDFQKRQLDIAKLSRESALLMLSKGVQKLKTTDAETLSPAMLVRFLEAASGILANAADAEATALGVDEMMARMVAEDEGR